MTPRVSVVIPCYNAAPYIAETLDSVLAQTWRDLEIIVVDDGSTDGSANIVEPFVRKGVKFIRQEKRGQTAALNNGLSHVNGDFVQYLDADDLIDREKISCQMARISHSDEIIASARWGRFYDDPKDTIFEYEDVYRDLAPLDWLSASRAAGLGMMFPAIWLIPRRIVRAIGPWREDLTLNNDAEYFTRALLAAKQVVFCAGASCRYRSGLHQSLSGQKSQAHWASQSTVLDLCENRIRQREDSERIRRGFALSWQHLAHACFPYDPAAADYALARARALHPVKIQPDGGSGFRLVRNLFGWRAARRLQAASQSARIVWRVRGRWRQQGN
jgi:glycosyltransferase involved in cell wall biosynthesis